MGHRKDDRPGNCQHAIGDHTIHVVCQRRTDNQQQQPGKSPADDAFVCMAAKTDAQRDQAYWQNYDQYFGMQMPLCELTEKRQHGNDDGH